MTRRLLHYESLLVVLILAVAAVMRFWELGDRPGYEWDEPVYADVGSRVAADGAVELKPQFGQERTPYLFHPPFYFLLLGAWFRGFGGDISDARVLAAGASLLVLALLYALLRPHLGALALVPVGLLATDGWVVYTNRIGWIENTMLILGIAGLIAYDRAFRGADRSGRSTPAFAGAGLLLGAATIYKHVAVYLVVAVLVNWLVHRRLHRQHLVLLATVAAVVAGYAAVMTVVYERDGHNAFLEQNRVQIERALGGHERRGTVESPRVAVTAILDQYRIFYATLALTLVSAVALAYRCLEAIRWRTLDDLRRSGILFAWALAAVASFAVIKLRFPHYAVMLLLPLYAFTAAEVGRAVRDRVGWQTLALAAVVVAFGLNGFTFGERFVHREDNALAAVREYARAEIPADALVLTEEPVGILVDRRYCKLVAAHRCRQADFVVLYLSHTQDPPQGRALATIMRGARLEATFRGFKETILVYRTLAGAA